jgi:hypothetical protein
MRVPAGSIGAECWSELGRWVVPEIAFFERRTSTCIAVIYPVVRHKPYVNMFIDVYSFSVKKSRR